MSACSSTTEIDEGEVAELPVSKSVYQNTNKSTQNYNDIDVNALLHELQLNHPVEQIGFQEKSFNTCQISSNRSPKPDCQTLYIGRLNFHAMCRDSTGTVETVQLTPLTTQNLSWKNGQKRGLTQTNNNGFGSLDFITPQSSRNGHLYLYLGNKVARKRFLDKWKMVLPGNWCSGY